MADGSNGTTITTRKKRIIWPWVVLGLLLLLGLWFFLLRGDSDTNSARTTGNATDDSATRQAGTAQDETAITQLDTLLKPGNIDAVLGKNINISDATVYSVVGDRSFTVGSADNYVYALLEQQLDEGGTEQAVQVKAGETRQLTGTILAVPNDTKAIVDTFQVTTAQAAELKERGFYIRVNSTPSS